MSTTSRPGGVENQNQAAARATGARSDERATRRRRRVLVDGLGLDGLWEEFTGFIGELRWFRDEKKTQ